MMLRNRLCRRCVQPCFHSLFMKKMSNISGVSLMQAMRAGIVDCASAPSFAGWSISRRQAIKSLAAATGSLMAASIGCAGGQSTTAPSPRLRPPCRSELFHPPQRTSPPRRSGAAGLSLLLGTGQPDHRPVLDHAANNSNGQMDTGTTEASIAATGFGLTALCIADQRGYLTSTYGYAANVTHAQIVERVQTTLSFHLNSMPSENGFFYHFNDVNTGQPLAGSEVSSIDTAWLMCGVLMARAWLNDPTVTSLATQLYERVNWPWFLMAERPSAWHGIRPRMRIPVSRPRATILTAN